MDVKKVAQELAPMLETSIKESVEAETKEFGKTLEELKKDVAEAKLLTKKVSGTEGKEARERCGKLFRALLAEDFAQVKVLSEGTAADGGYLVPTEFHREVIRVAELSGFARKYCSIFPMGTDSKDVTTLASGATAYIVWEKAAISESTPQFGTKVLNARKFAVLIKQTHELIDDNMTDEEVLVLVAKLSAESLAELEDAQVLTGSGAGLNMTGVLVDANVNVVTMGAGDTSFQDIDYAYLVSVKNAVPMKYKKAGKAVWAFSQDIFNHIEQLVDTTGRPLFRESMTTPDTYTLLGYPVEITEVMPDDADDAISTKFLAFGVFDFFALWDRKTITTEMGYASWDFEKQIKSQIVSERIAGTILIPEAFAVLKTAAV